MRHRYIKPRRSQQNGKVERSHRVDSEEFWGAYVAKKGWTVDDRFVFVDDGISGAEFTTRPGFLRLMNALKPRAPFQVLIMSEEEFGYDNVRLASHVERQICEPEAAVVRRTYEMYAAGGGYRHIAHWLNDQRSRCLARNVDARQGGTWASYSSASNSRKRGSRKST
jgi:hypothetical protein